MKIFNFLKPSYLSFNFGPESTKLELFLNRFIYCSIKQKVKVVLTNEGRPGNKRNVKSCLINNAQNLMENVPGEGPKRKIQQKEISNLYTIFYLTKSTRALYLKNHFI